MIKLLKRKFVILLYEMGYKIDKDIGLVQIKPFKYRDRFKVNDLLLELSQNCLSFYYIVLIVLCVNKIPIDPRWIPAHPEPRAPLQLSFVGLRYTNNSCYIDSTLICLLLPPNSVVDKYMMGDLSIDLKSLKEELRITEEMRDAFETVGKDTTRANHQIGILKLLLYPCHTKKTPEENRDILRRIQKELIEDVSPSVHLTGVVLHQPDKSVLWNGVNGVYQRSHEMCNGQPVYSRLTMPWAIWLSKVEPSDDEAARNCWCVKRKRTIKINNNNKKKRS